MNCFHIVRMYMWKMMENISFVVLFVSSYYLDINKSGVRCRCVVCIII